MVNFGGYTSHAVADAEPGNWYMIFGRQAFFDYVVDPSGGTVNVPRTGQPGRAEHHYA